MFFLSFSFSFLFVISPCVIAQSQDNCLPTGNGNGLPPVPDQGYRAGPESRIHHKHLAIIPSYRLNCCGNITEWDVGLNPGGARPRFNFIFQVWRPAPNVTVTGCYSLVDDFTSTSISIGIQQMSTINVARITPLPANQLQFQPGDVLGFYVESHGSKSDHDNGVVLLNSSSYTSEVVWHGSIIYRDGTAEMSKTASCPYPIGATGVLTSSTHAAPAISISIMTYSCHQSSSTTVAPSISLTRSLQVTYSTYNPHPFSTRTNSASNIHVPSTTTPIVSNEPASMIYNIDLISGVVTASIFACISAIAVTTVIAFAVAKRHRNVVTLTHSFGIALSNQVYGAPTVVNTNATSVNKPMREENEAIYTESVQYHTVGPDTLQPSLHIYSCIGDRRDNSNYSKAAAGVVGMDTDCYTYENPNPDTKLNQESTAYETPREEVFDAAGLYVPTAEKRSKLGAQVNQMQGQSSSTGVYNRLKFFTEDQIYWTPASTMSDLYSQLASKKYREIPREQIKTDKSLGSGEFGNVYEAKWSISGTTKGVAVKTLKPGSSENDRVRFLQEAAIMGQFSHSYVVKLYGVITVGHPIMICTELMINGDLRRYLGTVSPHDKRCPEELELQLLKFSRQIASGMAYLSKKAFVHRDLAARNILLDESLNCKISDFGMARDLADDTYYTVQSKGGKIPVKWTAPEALFYKKYSTDSDVWSYGMVLFEIWSIGKKPFSDMSNNEVMRKINSGYCQPPPPGISKTIYQIMVNCWNPVHSQRPSFSKISATLNASSSTLLQWTGDDHSVAGELGGQLSDAKFLHQDLQNSYRS